MSNIGELHPRNRMALIRKAEAARRLGVTPQRVSLLVRTRELPTYRSTGGTEMVDEDDVERMASVIESRRRRVKFGDLQPIEPDPEPAPQPSRRGPGRPRTRADLPPAGTPPKKKIADITEDDIQLFDRNGHLDVVACRAWAEFEKARKLNVERLATEGRYVEAAPIKAKIEATMLTIRKGILATPSRWKAIHPEATQAQFDSMERLLREALEKGAGLS